MDKIKDDEISVFVNSMDFRKKYIAARKTEKTDPEDIYFKVEFLGNGEYNCNYTLYMNNTESDETIEKSVFRINYGSQMNLKNQIEYEYNALCALENSHVTPKPYFYEDRTQDFKRSYLVMEFIEGRPLSYEKDLMKAADTLAKVHTGSDTGEFEFIFPENGFAAMIEECENMYKIYRESTYFDRDIEKRVKKLFNCAYKISGSYKKVSEPVLINTELNSSNFIVNNEKTVLIDWEKPIIGEKEQDLGHFLAPTTTFWKTDVILSKKEVSDFIERYVSGYNRYAKEKSLKMISRDDVEKKTVSYISMNCLRGITWCLMAWVQYNSEYNGIRNEFTYNKLKDYMRLSFLDMVIENYCREEDLLG